MPLSFWCFDLLSLKDEDFFLPAAAQRAPRRAANLLPTGSLHFSKGFTDPLALLTAAEEHHLEVIVSKRIDAPYRSGQRQEWVKVKIQAWRANRGRWAKMNTL